MFDRLRRLLRRGARRGAGASREPIFEFVVRHLDPVTGRVGQDGEVLPDEREFDDGLHFAPGAREGVEEFHTEGAEPTRSVRRLRAAIARAAAGPGVGDVAALEDLLVRKHAASAIDALVDALARSHDVDRDRLLVLAKALVNAATDREAVKVALGLFGLGVDDEAFRILDRLARHPEFTGHALDAAATAGRADEWWTWSIAKATSGWGRVRAVHALSGATDPDVRAWLLREGHRDAVLPEYTALVCAETGGLVEALRGEPDDVALDRAAELLLGLLGTEWGPGGDLGAYGDAGEALDLFLEHVERRPPTLERLFCAAAIERCAKDGEAPGSTGLRARAVLDDARSVELVEGQMAAGDPEAFHRAGEVADAMGLDAWEARFARLERDPLVDAGLWLAPAATSDPARMGRVVALAESVLPLAEIATGPDEALGFEPEYEPHAMLEAVLQSLCAFPGLGWDLIATGLASPTIRNRNMAVRAIGAWGEERWNGDVRAALRTARAREPDADIAADLDRVLEGRAMEPPSWW